jgi:hypothetical protein
MFINIVNEEKPTILLFMNDRRVSNEALEALEKNARKAKIEFKL